MKELTNELKEHIIDVLNLEEMTPEDIDNDAPLFGEGLGLDSIDALELIVMLEKVYGIKIKDPNKVPGVGFDMNGIMGIGYGIERACEEAGIDAHIAGGYVGNNTQLYLNKEFPIIESTEEERNYGIMNGAGDWFMNGTAQEIYGKEFGPDAESAFRFTHDGAYKNWQRWQNNGDDGMYEVRKLPPTNDEILSKYRMFIGNRMPVVETKEGEIYFKYDPKRNVFAYGGASNAGLLEEGHIDYDKSQSMQWNLEQLHDEIYEKYGYPEEELTPTDESEEVVNEEVDIGWDLEAMRDDAARRSRERDAKDKLDEYKIVFNGREMRKKYAKHLISNAERDNVISFGKYKELLSAFDQAKPGDEFDIPEMEKYLKGWFVQAYAES